MNEPSAILLLLIPIAYITGSVPFGLLVGLSKGVDPRKAGSGNIGATNVGRLLGGKYFAIVFTLDLLKGMLPMLTAAAVLHAKITGADLSAKQYTLWILVGAAAFSGHLFSCFLKFKGGKGVATSCGVMFGLFPYFTIPGVLSAIVWIIIFQIWRYVSLASIAGAVAFPVLYIVLAIVMGWPVFAEQFPLLIFALLIAAMIVVKHRSNIARLRAGTENRFARKSVVDDPARQRNNPYMKSALRPLAVVGIVAILAGIMALQLRADRPEIVKWGHDFAAAQSQSRSGGGPMLAYFTATWCGPCQRMKSTTFADEQVESALHKFTIVKLDVDEQKDLARNYHVESIPMFVILDNNGNVVRQTSGYMNSDEFLAWLKG